MTSESPQQSYSTIIKLIFENAQQSIKELDDSVNVINTTLSAVTGFGIILIKFVGDLPDQSLQFSSPDSIMFSCYLCSLLKVSCLALVLASILISLSALLTKRGKVQIISPAEQVEKCIRLSEDEYRLLFIKIYDENIDNLASLRNRKAKRLYWSGIVLVIAATLSALEILLTIWI